MKARVVMLADIDYFFAQCEEVRNPAFKGKPVVVGVYSGRTSSSGVVSTANYVARSFGVKSGMPLYLALKKLEHQDAIFLPVDYDFYQQVSDRIMALFRTYADVFEQVGIDEAYLDVTKKVQESFEAAADLALRMKHDVDSREHITFSVGIGPNKLVAKIAADQQKPNGLTVVKPSEVQAFLNPLPVERLLGVGQKTLRKMQLLGIKTIGDLASFDVQKLVDAFGKALGVYFHNAANGLDDAPVSQVDSVESISRISTLKEDTRDVPIMLERITKLAEEVQKELSARRMNFRQVSVMLVTTDLTAKSRSLTLERPARDAESILTSTRVLLEKFLQDSALPVRRVGIKVSRLTREEVSQKSLTSFMQESPDTRNSKL